MDEYDVPAAKANSNGYYDEWYDGYHSGMETAKKRWKTIMNTFSAMAFHFSKNAVWFN